MTSNLWSILLSDKHAINNDLVKLEILLLLKIIWNLFTNGFKLNSFNEGKIASNPSLSNLSMFSKSSKVNFWRCLSLSKKITSFLFSIKNFSKSLGT